MINIERKATFVSLVIISKYVDKVNLPDFLHECYDYLNSNFVDYEIVVINEQVNFPKKIPWDDILTKTPSIRVIEVAYDIDKDIARTIDLDNSIGDYVVLFDPDSEPLSIIRDSIEMCERGCEVIVGVDAKPRHSICYSVLRPISGVLLSSINYNIPKDSTSFRCLTRQAVNIVTRSRTSHHQIYVKMSQCDLPTGTILYTTEPEKLKIKTVNSAVKELIKLIIFNSIKPLRLMTFIGVVASIFSFLFGMYSFIIKLFNDSVADGWTSIVVLISFMFMILFMILSFFGEYLARILDEQNKNDPYWIIGEKSSSVMLNTDRVNVLESPL
ncbi:hypothetical protein ACVZYT_000074 [Yersinia enterocolitica]